MRRVCFLTLLLIATSFAGAPAATQDKPAKGRAKVEASPSTPLNLNTATAAQLQALPGIGAATAKLIIDHRQKNGGFKKVEELMNIKGIGEKSFLKLKPLVVVPPEKSERQQSPGHLR
jgi:competence protein ComEA